MFGRKHIFILFLLASGLTAAGQQVQLRASQSIPSVNFKVDIYPNPATDYLTVEFTDTQADNVEFELRSMIGTTVRISPEKIGYNQYRITLKEYATGYYFLIVKDEKMRFKKAYKFLKR